MSVYVARKIFSILFIKQSEWNALNNIMPRINGKAEPKTHLLLIESAKGWVFSRSIRNLQAETTINQRKKQQLIFGYSNRHIFHIKRT